MTLDWRFLPLPALTGVYVLFSAITYTDHPRKEPDVVLDRSEERRGLALWRKHNCQACHQLYGFGGFLGPDLTNCVTEATPDHEFSRLLDEGKGRMPAFHMNEEEQADLLAFLRAMNRSGRSQPDGLASRREVPERSHLALLLDAWQAADLGGVPPDVAKGVGIWDTQGCGLCHAPFADGKKRAPDLFVRARKLPFEAFREVITKGRWEMPGHAMADRDLENLAALVKWVRENRAGLAPMNDRLLDRQSFSLGEVSWFEYR